MGQVFIESATFSVKVNVNLVLAQHERPPQVDVTALMLHVIHLYIQQQRQTDDFCLVALLEPRSLFLNQLVATVTSHVTFFPYGLWLKDTFTYFWEFIQYISSTS